MTHGVLFLEHLDQLVTIAENTRLNEAAKLLVSGTDLLNDVSQRMQARHLKNILVIDGHKRPVGVLTARAILRALPGNAENQEAQLIDNVKVVGYR